MPKKTRKVIFFLIGYMIALLVGFRSGEVYNRMKNKIQVEKVDIQYDMPPEYIAVEIREESKDCRVFYWELAKDHIYMKIFFNEKLRPLLKLKNLQIYTRNGERIY